MADLDDLTQQLEEIEALSAIYGHDFLVVDDTNRIFEFRVSHENDSWWSATLQVLLPPQYPSEVPPVFEIYSVWMNDAEMFEATDLLYTIYRDNSGQIVLYQWVEGLREFIDTKFNEHRSNKFQRHYSADCSPGEETRVEEGRIQHNEIKEELLEIPSSKLETEPDIALLETHQLEETCHIPEVVHGEPFTDRKSTFQAHLAHIVTLDQVKQVLEELKRNKKICNATHNVVAYRIFCKDKKSYIQDCDDDGESAAGSRLLHLLQILDVKNVVVVVTRWYGGIHLGPDRFKHYNNCARSLMKVEGFVEMSSSQSNSRESKNKSRLRIKKRP